MITAGQEVAERERDFIAEAARKALRHLDAMPLEEYFAEMEKDTPHVWARTLMAMHDELRSALNVVGLDYHKE